MQVGNPDNFLHSTILLGAPPRSTVALVVSHGRQKSTLGKQWAETKLKPCPGLNGRGDKEVCTMDCRPRKSARWNPISAAPKEAVKELSPTFRAEREGGSEFGGITLIFSLKYKSSPWWKFATTSNSIGWSNEKFPVLSTCSSSSHLSSAPLYHQGRCFLPVPEPREELRPGLCDGPPVRSWYLGVRTCRSSVWAVSLRVYVCGHIWNLTTKYI